MQVQDEPAQVWADAERIHDLGAAPVVAIDADGDAMTVWKQRRTDVPSFWQVWSTRHHGIWDTPEQISEPTVFGNVGFPQVTVHPDGDAVAVWDHEVDAGSDDARYDIWSNGYAPDVGWGTPARIEHDDRGDARGPQVAMDAEGHVVAVWHQSDGSRFGIWSTRYSPGSGWGGVEHIAEESRRDATHPQVAVNPSGNAVAVWRESDGSRDVIWSNRYTPGGGWGNPERIGADTGGSAGAPQIALDEDGNGLAVWALSDGARYSIWSNHHSPTGGWDEAQLIETDDRGDALNPQIAMDASGIAIAVWEQFDGLTSNIWSNRYDAGWGGAELVAAGDSGAATNAEIAVGLSGTATSVWQQSDGTQNNIWSNRYSRGGWGTVQRVDTDCTHILESGPDVAMDHEGTAVAVWTFSIRWQDPCHGVFTNRTQ